MMAVDVTARGGIVHSRPGGEIAVCDRRKITTKYQLRGHLFSTLTTFLPQEGDPGQLVDVLSGLAGMGHSPVAPVLGSISHVLRLKLEECSAAHISRYCPATSHVWTTCESGGIDDTMAGDHIVRVGVVGEGKVRARRRGPKADSQRLLR